MPRKYDSSRRAKAAQQTRQSIIEAAFRLHGQGITDFESLAREADVSLATVRKHYPTREHVFEGCTAHGLQLVAMPDLDRLSAIEDPASRTREAVRQVYSMYEELAGQLWLGYRAEHESPALANVLQQIAGLNSEVTRLIMAGWPHLEGDHPEVRGAIFGFLSPLTHRALRMEANLPAEQVLATTTAAVLQVLHGAENAGEGEAARPAATSRR